MKTSQSGLSLIKKFEGLRLRPYKCAAGLWTVCYGHLIGNGLTLPDSWNRLFTIEEAYALLATDLKRFERGVTMYCPVQLTQNQFDALVSFSFNLGLGALQRSTVRQKINRGDIAGAGKVLLRYTRAGGKVLRGLVLRRKDEYALLMSN